MEAVGAQAQGQGMQLEEPLGAHFGCARQGLRNLPHDVRMVAAVHRRLRTLNPNSICPDRTMSDGYNS